METPIHTKTHTQMFIAAVLIIAKKWNQPKLSKQLMTLFKMWYIYTKKYHLAIKKNDVLTHAIILNLENMQVKEARCKRLYII